MPLSKLELHAMACQGIHLNGGTGLEVNPMEVLTLETESPQGLPFYTEGSDPVQDVQLSGPRPGDAGAQADLLGQQQPEEED